MTTCTIKQCKFMQPPKKPSITHATTKWDFHITQAEINKAKKAYTTTTKNDKGTIQGCEHPAACVVAQGIMRSILPGYQCMVQVGANVVKIYYGKEYAETIIIYKVPAKLTKAIKSFDKTGLWDLEPGSYSLLPHTKSPNRHQYIGKAKNPRPKNPDRFRAASTRRVLRSDKNITKKIV